MVPVCRLSHTVSGSNSWHWRYVLACAAPFTIHDTRPKQRNHMSRKPDLCRCSAAYPIRWTRASNSWPPLAYSELQPPPARRAPRCSAPGTASWGTSSWPTCPCCVLGYCQLIVYYLYAIVLLLVWCACLMLFSWPTCPGFRIPPL